MSLGLSDVQSKTPSWDVNKINKFVCTTTVHHFIATSIPHCFPDLPDLVGLCSERFFSNNYYKREGLAY